MLTITVPAGEIYDDATSQFIYVKAHTLKLEHSLVSLSKWESKWCKPFISTTNKTDEETIDYIKCMTITQNVDPNVYRFLSADNLKEIDEYINAPMTATFFSEEKGGKRSREIITSELIYYWMITLQIPPEYQKWHLNRLLTLIHVCTIKNAPAKKRSKTEIAKDYAALNEERRKKYNTKG